MDKEKYDIAYERIRQILLNLSSMPREGLPMEHC